MSKSEVRNEWSYPCTPFYALMICTGHLQLFDVGFSISDYAASKKGLIMNNEPEMAWKANLRYC
jgi:hypothetical protein